MPTGTKIKEIRKQKGLTQKQLGDLCGIADSNIRKYENGKQNPKIETLQKIAAALDVPLAEITETIINDEIDNISYTSGLELFRTFIEFDIFPYEQDRKNEILNMIDLEIKKGIDVEDRDAYYFDLEAKFSHMILNDLLDPYKDADITDITELVAYFLKLNAKGQNKVLQYENDMLNIKYYKAD